MSLFDEDRAMRTVPRFVGLAYQEAVALERRLGLHIAGPDPDAAPISNAWWEHQELVVLTQSPPPGARIDRRTSVVVTLGEPEAPVAARVRVMDPSAPSARADRGPGAVDPPMRPQG